MDFSLEGDGGSELYLSFDGMGEYGSCIFIYLSILDECSALEFRLEELPFADFP